jgi:hypothetical protein
MTMNAGFAGFAAFFGSRLRPNSLNQPEISVITVATASISLVQKLAKAAKAAKKSDTPLAAPKARRRLKETKPSDTWTTARRRTDHRHHPPRSFSLCLLFQSDGTNRLPATRHLVHLVP